MHNFSLSNEPLLDFSHPENPIEGPTLGSLVAEHLHASIFLLNIFQRSAFKKKSLQYCKRKPGNAFKSL